MVQIKRDVMDLDNPLEALRIRRLFMGKATNIVASSNLAPTARLDAAKTACQVLQCLDLLRGRVVP